jgi:uncharacterized protein (TIGR03000 family)
MRRLRDLLRLGLIAPTAASLATPATAGDPSPYGTVHNVVDPPGWFGPGPNRHKWKEPGPGNNWSYYGLVGGPFVTSPFFPGYYPAAYGSVWSNGLGLYGPPVPTYGPTPGSFGGATADKLFFRSTPPPPRASFPGLGWAGYRNPSPRPVHPTVGVYPDVPGPFPMSLPAPTPVTQSIDPTCIRVAVKVPDKDAAVWVNKAETKQKGADRVYVSPPLPGGGKYQYELTAEWTENGRPRSETRTVTALPGEAVVVDFTRPTPGDVHANAAP